MTYYEVLQVVEDASPDEIRAAYLRLVQEHHPDRHVGDVTDVERDRFKQIQEAYEVLYDEEQRRLYDNHRSIPKPRDRGAVVTPAYRGGGPVRQPIDPSVRRDVPDDWLRRGGTYRSKKKPVRTLIFVAVLIGLATTVVPQCSQYMEEHVELDEEIPLPELRAPLGPERSSEPTMSLVELNLEDIGDSSPVGFDDDAMSEEDLSDESDQLAVGQGDDDQLICSLTTEPLLLATDEEFPIDAAIESTSEVFQAQGDASQPASRLKKFASDFSQMDFSQNDVGGVDLLALGSDRFLAEGDIALPSLELDTAVSRGSRGRRKSKSQDLPLGLDNGVKGSGDEILSQPSERVFRPPVVLPTSEHFQKPRPNSGPFAPPKSLSNRFLPQQVPVISTALPLGQSNHGFHRGNRSPEDALGDYQSLRTTTDLGRSQFGNAAADSNPNATSNSMPFGQGNSNGIDSSPAFRTVPVFSSPSTGGGNFGSGFGGSFVPTWP